MAAYKELSYRTFDSLVDSVRLDLITFNQTDDIDTADLIKVAQKINYELGLKIYMSRETILDIEHGRAKLPADFHQLEIALICHHYRSISTAPWNGNVWLEQIETQTSGTTCDICEITHTGPCPVVVSNPFIQGRTRSICNGQTNIKVLQFCAASVQCYEHFERLYIKPSRQASSFCLNTQFRDCANTGQIVGNFIETSINHGKIYITYKGGLEDEDGNLLVLDHPAINFYYEYAIKLAVLEKLYLNGEDMQQRLQYINAKLNGTDGSPGYRHQALSIANTPDYHQWLKLGEVNRQMAYRKFYHPIDKWHGYIGWANNVDNFTNPGY